MKKIFFLSLLHIILLGYLSAQHRVIKSNEKPEKSVNKGIFYNLPTQSIGLILCVKKSVRTPGIYAEYAESLLGLNRAILTEETRYELSVKTVFCIPSAKSKKMYYVIPDGKSKLPKMSFSPWGTLYGVNLKENEMIDFSEYAKFNQSFMQVLGENETEKKNTPNFHFVQWNLTESYDTLYKKVITDTQTFTQQIIKTDLVQKSQKQKAEDAAKQILKFRENKNYLLSGSNEVNYSTETLRLMIEKLYKDETELLRFFTGFEEKSEQSYYFEIFPEDTLYYPIAAFSEQEGLSSWKTKADEDIISLELRPDTKRTADIEKMEKQIPVDGAVSGFYYNIPAATQVLLYHQGNVLYQKQLKFSQFGKDFALPSRCQKIRLQAETGELIDAE